MQGVILAAGKGKRLQPVTPARTKAMAPVAGKPIVARVLDLLVQNGIQEIILLISPDDPEIVPYFEQHTPSGVTFTFVVQHERLGMAHALGLIAPHLRGDFVMSACDNLVPPEHIAALLEAHRTRQANATLSLMAIDIAYSASTGIVEWQADDTGFIRRIVEKPQPADAPSNVSSLPLYVFSARLLDYLSQVKPSPRGEYELQDAIQLLIDHSGFVTGVLTPVRWQLTNVDDLLELNRHYLSTEPVSAQIQTTEIGVDTRIIPPVRIDAGSVIGNNCVIGPHVYLEANCVVADGVHLTNAIVLRNSIIPRGTVVRDTVFRGA